jgi:hypothetical protein
MYFLLGYRILAQPENLFHRDSTERNKSSSTGDPSQRVRLTNAQLRHRRQASHFTRSVIFNYTKEEVHTQVHIMICPLHTTLPKGTISVPSAYPFVRLSDFYLASSFLDFFLHWMKIILHWMKIILHWMKIIDWNFICGLHLNNCRSSLHFVSLWPTFHWIIPPSWSASKGLCITYNTLWMLVIFFSHS